MTKNAVTKPTVGICPACDTRVRFEKAPKMGQFVTCPECENMLEVVRLSPIKLDWAFEEPFEDYDEYEDDYGDIDDDQFDDDDFDDSDDDSW